MLSFWVIVNRVFTDTLISYAPADTVLYAHFSRPKINDSTRIDQILTAVFSDLGLADYDSLDIDREVAIIGRLKDGQVKYGAIIKTDRPSKVKKILTEAKLPYKSLSYDRFLLADESLISDYRPDKNSKIKSSIQKRFHAFSSINIYISEAFFTANDNDLNLNLAYSLFKNENNDLILSFKAKGRELKMLYGGILSSARPLARLALAKSQSDLPGDFIFASSDFFTLLNNWKNNLKEVSNEDYQSFASSQLNTYLNTYLSSDNRQVLLAAKKNNNNSGWLFGDYDFYVSLENIYAGKAEEMLKIIMASKYPMVKSVYLSDGTRVEELLPDTEAFSFLSKNGLNYLYSPDGQFKLMYKSVGSNIVISNSEALINQDWPELGFNYLMFKSDFLLDYGLGKYLKAFDFLEINKEGLILE